ncbi:hypothetical protein TVAG_027230 [Trichomonas vaginalis G3]|uniref:Uncharacterized protein n=1 Tax=Trichomonas vaginalis (strain ATCC PRA-98 / G3) TaxID=412133 RepID=A2F1G8_TRIV3|nr:hypothetical protein TVAGG3_0947840 [Trichomonas vaginalis G3]EAY01255.1 hypothetical protein TVAG_027230 [Trichomonas vaginalis G3]KAI5486996.1 hypothetical protein TVAGG3_0947840 [Trichomonas vaginalis G3]|eukprot:XP_001314070.1 hypothetical protein [Trichomonas vaginalis G3]
MLSTLEDYINGSNPVSSPVIDMDSDLSIELALNGDRSSQFLESTFFDEESQLQLSNLEDLFVNNSSNGTNQNHITRQKRKKVIKSIVFHPFSSVENTEITVQNLKRLFKQPPLI